MSRVETQVVIRLDDENEKQNDHTHWKRQTKTT